MIITRINGGLGNQMFQYALGLSVAHAKGVPLKLDVTSFGEPQAGAPRPYQLDAFNITAPAAEVRDFLRVGLPPTRRTLLATTARKVFRFFDNRRPFVKRAIVDEPSHLFTPEVFKVRDNCLLVGNWQSEKYFIEVADTVRKEFTLKDGFGAEAQRFAKMISEEKRGVPASLHIRRGDSVTIAYSMSVHGSPDISYYRDAAKLMREKVPSAVFYIFTDDVPWVQEQLLAELEPAVIVSSPGAIKDAEDIILMSLCNHHITAHSSFSWWGAWLNPRSDKIVIGPKRWYKRDIDTRDLTPASWIRIDNKLI